MLRGRKRLGDLTSTRAASEFVGGIIAVVLLMAPTYVAILDFYQRVRAETETANVARLIAETLAVEPAEVPNLAQLQTLGELWRTQILGMTGKMSVHAALSIERGGARTLLWNKEVAATTPGATTPCNTNRANDISNMLPDEEVAIITQACLQTPKIFFGTLARWANFTVDGVWSRRVYVTPMRDKAWDGEPS